MFSLKNVSVLLKKVTLLVTIKYKIPQNKNPTIESLAKCKTRKTFVFIDKDFIYTSLSSECSFTISSFFYLVK